jgi:WD40 repeat protein
MRILATGSYDKTCKLYKAEGRNYSYSMTTPIESNVITAVDFTDHSKSLLTASANHVKIWDVNTIECYMTIPF